MPQKVEISLTSFTTKSSILWHYPLGDRGRKDNSLIRSQLAQLLLQLWPAVTRETSFDISDPIEQCFYRHLLQFPPRGFDMFGRWWQWCRGIGVSTHQILP